VSPALDVTYPKVPYSPDHFKPTHTPFDSNRQLHPKISQRGYGRVRIALVLLCRTGALVKPKVVSPGLEAADPGFATKSSEMALHHLAEAWCEVWNRSFFTAQFGGPCVSQKHLLSRSITPIKTGISADLR
jgi:hypothetical protein